MAVAVAVGVTVSSSDKKETGESSTTATSPPGPANWVPIGGDLNGKVATFSGGSVSLSSSGTILAFGNLMLQEGEFDLVETSKFGGVEVYQLVDNVAWVHRGDWNNHITQSIEGCCHSVAMDEEGTTLVVGAPGNGMNDTGLVQVFRYDGDTTPWQTIGSAISGLDSPLTWGGEQFGYSVSLSSNGTILASGAPNYVYEGNDSATLGQVRVYRFRHDVDQWQPVGQFLDDGFEYQYSRFGSSVALSAAGDILAVGAPDFDSPFDHAGQVQVFRLQSDEWIRIGDPLYGEGRLDRLGISVALSADGLTLAAGAPGNKKDEDTFSGMGHVRVYKLFGNDWSQIGQDIDGFLQFGRLGSSVALSADGSYVVVGAPGIQTGLVRVFKFQADEGVWEKVGDDLEGEYVNDAFGTSVAVSNDGSIVSVGAPFNQEGRDDPNGHVRSFRLAG